MDTLTHDEIRAAVRNRYGAIAETRGVSAPTDEGSCCGSTGNISCCGCESATTLDTKAHAYGYSAEDTSAVPEGANLGLGCGNPIALASLRPGETVLDLGSGAGFDCFLAARAVGETGRVIGVDRGRYTTLGGEGADRHVVLVSSLECEVEAAPHLLAAPRKLVRVLGGRDVAHRGDEHVRRTEAVRQLDRLVPPVPCAREVAVHHGAAARGKLSAMLEHAGGDPRNVRDLAAAEAEGVARALLLPSVVLAVLSMDHVFGSTLFHLPGLVSQRVTTRFLVMPVLALVVMGCVQLDSWGAWQRGHG